jgi:D-alanine-D-alanine ligase
MKVGITYDLKAEGPANGVDRPDLPDDFQEEFDSPATIEAIAAVLRGLGHDVVNLGDGRELLERLLAEPVDFVFNFAEGQGVSRSREARVPAVLEMLGIPYTGSDPLTLAVTLDKDVAKRLVASAGVAVPQGFVIQPEEDPEQALTRQSATSRHALPYPAIVKPAWEGSSKGIRNKCLVTSRSELLEVVASLRTDHVQPVLVEDFIEGDEVTVGMVGNAPPRIVGIMRVVPLTATERFVYSLEVKRDFRRQVRYECPAPLPLAVTAAIENAALTAWRALGCRDVARVDFRLRDGRPYFLEVNPLPGLHPDDSDLVIMGSLVGWSHARLVTAILESARSRCLGHLGTSLEAGPASAKPQAAQELVPRPHR